MKNRGVGQWGGSLVHGGIHIRTLIFRNLTYYKYLFWANQKIGEMSKDHYDHHGGLRKIILL